MHLCETMKNTTAYRVAITQIVILIGYSVVLFCLGAFTLEEFELEDDEKTRLQNGFYVCAGLYIIPLLLSVVLTIGVFRRNVGLVRIWILISIIETVILLAITTAGSIYFTVALDAYYGISIIALQIIVSLWKIECIVMINSYYKEQLLEGVDPKIVVT